MLYHLLIRERSNEKIYVLIIYIFNYSAEEHKRKHKKNFIYLFI